MASPPDKTADLIAEWKRLAPGDVTVGVSGVSARVEVGTVSAVGTAAAGSEVVGISAVLNAQLDAVTLEASAVVSDGRRGISVSAALVDVGGATDQGQLVTAVRPAWRRILNEVTRDPRALYQLSPRQFEEFNAGGYEEDGWEEVTLTPRSADGGRDIIAYRPDFGGLRVLVQVKLLKPESRVTAEEVRAFSWVLQSDRAASKGVFTTTTRFAPGVQKEFADLVPTRLDLRDGVRLQRWLKKIREGS